MRFAIEKEIQTVFIRDRVFWKRHYMEVEKWLVERGWDVQGTSSGFFEYDNEEQLIMFLLRWS